MSKAGPEIGLLPIPIEKESGEGQFVMVWRITMCDLPTGAEVLSHVKSLSKHLSVSIEAAENRDLTLTATRGPGTFYMDAYLAAWYAMDRLEQITGPIAFIQGLPREKWDGEFSMIKRLISTG